MDEELSQARDYKDSLADILAPQILSSWLKVVAMTANDICKDSGTRYEKGAGYCGEIITPTKKSMECLLRAIDSHIGNAPEIAREMLASYRARMQAGLAS